jgi:hypothetical protein
MPMRASGAWLTAALVLTARAEAQAGDPALCGDRIGPTMEALRSAPEPIFTDPFSPSRSVFQRLLDIRFADTLPVTDVCRLLRKYDLLLVEPARLAGFSVRVLTRRRASSLEELEHWRETIRWATGVETVALVPVPRWLARPL